MYWRRVLTSWPHTQPLNLVISLYKSQILFCFKHSQKSIDEQVIYKKNTPAGLQRLLPHSPILARDPANAAVLMSQLLVLRDTRSFPVRVGTRQTFNCDVTIAVCIYHAAPCIIHCPITYVCISVALSTDRPNPEKFWLPV